MIKFSHFCLSLRKAKKGKPLRILVVLFLLLISVINFHIFIQNRYHIELSLGVYFKLEALEGNGSKLNVVNNYLQGCNSNIFRQQPHKQQDPPIRSAVVQKYQIYPQLST